MEAGLLESEKSEPYRLFGNAGCSTGSQVYVAPRRRRQCAHACSVGGSPVSLETVKVEVVRALNRVSEGNAEPVLHQLLAVLNRSALKVRIAYCNLLKLRALVTVFSSAVAFLYWTGRGVRPRR